MYDTPVVRLTPKMWQSVKRKKVFIFDFRQNLQHPVSSTGAVVYKTQQLWYEFFGFSEQLSCKICGCITYLLCLPKNKNLPYKTEKIEDNTGQNSYKIFGFILRRFCPLSASNFPESFASWSLVMDRNQKEQESENFQEI